MAFAMKVGRRLCMAELKRNLASAGKGTGAIEGAIFALFGLLLAFTFSGAASRFEHRRDLVVPGVNAIGTAYLSENKSKLSYLREFHPEVAVEFEKRLRLIQSAKVRDARLLKIALGELETNNGEGEHRDCPL